MKRILLVIGTLFIAHSFALASNGQYSAKIQVNVDAELSTNAKVIITVYEKYFKYAEGLNAGQYKQTVEADGAQIKINLPKPMVYFTIDLLVDSLPYYFQTRGKTFLVENDDEIYFNVRKNRVVISGKGSAKVRCQNWLYGMELYPRPALVSREKEPFNPADVLAELTTRSDRFYSRQLSVLEDYKSNISKQAYQRMKEDCFGLRKLTDLKFIKTRINHPTRAKVWLPAIDAYLAERFLSKFPDKSFQTESKNIIELLYEKEKLSLKIRNKSKKYNSTRDENFRFFLDAIYKSYSGTMQGQVIFYAFSRYNENSKNTAHLINEALIRVQDRVSRKGLQELLYISSYGAEVRPFRFRDIKGETYTLEDFKGKVVVFDFWFKGCGGCIQVHKELKQVRKSFEDNQDIVFVTVNVDYKKKTWIEGIESGLYTDDDMLNLHIGASGMKDPWLNYYGFVGYPHVVIIGKDSKLVSIDPPRPTEAEQRQNFIDLILSEI